MHGATVKMLEVLEKVFYPKYDTTIFCETKNR
jgi:hypothetical protein